MMKVLFAAVPQWYPVSPYLAGALLAGQLKNAGYEADTYDFNIEFFNDILTADYLGKSLENAKEFLKDDSSLDFSEELSEDINNKRKRTALMRRQIIEDYLADEGKNAASVIKEAEKAVNVFKSEAFFDPEKLYKAKDTIMSALDIASLAYTPSRIMLDNYIANPMFTYDFADVDYQCKHSDVNMFLPYFENKLGSVGLKEYDLICLSITDLSQIVPGLTLARLLKARTDAKIALGGNFIYKIEEDLKKISGVFDEYCDYLSVGDGETAVVELAEYIAGKRDIKEVHSLVYRDENSVVHTNERAPCLKLDNVAYPDFDSYDFTKYFSPETVIPHQDRTSQKIRDISHFPSGHSI